MSLPDLNYGMLCVLEQLLLSGNESWHSYIQHMKFVARQSLGRNYVDQAFVGYDRMVVDKYLQDTHKGFAAGDVLSVSSNFHAANFRKDFGKPFKKSPKARNQRTPRVEGSSDEFIEIPSDWPDDICFYFNRRRCYGRCSRSHVFRKCRGVHRDTECKAESKN